MGKRLVGMYSAMPLAHEIVFTLVVGAFLAVAAYYMASYFQGGLQRQLAGIAFATLAVFTTGHRISSKPSKHKERKESEAF